MTTHFSTREVAELLGTETWRVRRLFEAGDLPDPPRIGLARAIPREQIPAIVEALRARGWWPEATVAATQTMEGDA